MTLHFELIILSLLLNVKLSVIVFNFLYEINNCVRSRIPVILFLN